MPNEPPPKPLIGEVLPPAKAESHLPIDRPLTGIPLFNRMRYRSIRKELEEYLAVLQTKNAVLLEITQTQQITETFNRGLVRSERVDDLRRIEALKIDAELDGALEAAMQQHRQAKVNAMADRARMALLEADAIEAERRLEALKNPPPQPEQEPSRSASERITAEIARLRKQETEIIAALVGEFESEDDLPEEDRELIRDIKLATRNQIASLIEALRS